jgi:hypothetical protein
MLCRVVEPHIEHTCTSDQDTSVSEGWVPHLKSMDVSSNKIWEALDWIPWVLQFLIASL